MRTPQTPGPPHTTRSSSSPDVSETEYRVAIALDGAPAAEDAEEDVAPREDLVPLFRLQGGVG